MNEMRLSQCPPDLAFVVLLGALRMSTHSVLRDLHTSPSQLLCPPRPVVA